jgi:hypothetical protein
VIQEWGEKEETPKYKYKSSQPENNTPMTEFLLSWLLRSRNSHECPPSYTSNAWQWKIMRAASISLAGELLPPMEGHDMEMTHSIVN